MAKTLLGRAETLYLRGKHSDVISLLEPVVLEGSGDDMLSMYRQSFDLYFLLGMSCLHMGDAGGAWSYLDRAGKLRPGSVNLALGRAVIAIVQGKIPEACGYYLEALKRDPDNKMAADGLEFLRKADDETVHQAVVTEKIFRFCPSPRRKKKPVFAVVAIACLALAGGVAFSMWLPKPSVEQRADLSAFDLSQDERRSAAEEEGSFTYFLTSRQIVDSYENIKRNFNQFKDNAAQVEINRLLNSNASADIQRKARMLMDYLSEPGFDTITDRYSYAQVAAEPLLYSGCWVAWEGMAANIERGEDSTDFSFLVGYSRSSDLQGVVQVHFARALNFDQERPFELLGQIKSEGGKIVLLGSSIHQSIRAGASGQGRR